MGKSRSCCSPSAYSTFKGKKGHSSAEMQLELIKYIQTLLPWGANVIFMGDGEFDSCDVIQFIKSETNWRYICRTARNIKVFHQGEWIKLEDLPIPDQE